MELPLVTGNPGSVPTAILLLLPLLLSHMQSFTARRDRPIPRKQGDIAIYIAVQSGKGRGRGFGRAGWTGEDWGGLPGSVVD